MLTEDDAFNSQALLGNIAYRLPSIEKLFGMPMEQFDTFQTLTFWVEVLANHDLVEEPVRMKCKSENRCRLVYTRHYTPMLHYISPPVVYHEAYTELWFDPKSTMSLISNLASDEMPFINARIQGSLLDFEFNVESSTWFGGWRTNRVRGQVGELPIADNHSISMQWETGKAYVLPHYAQHCNVDNTTCYYAKTVPVIFNVSSNSGYWSGGQNLTVYGHGFSSGNITAKVDGVDCRVTQFQDRSFSCEVGARTGGPSTTNVSQQGSSGIRDHFINKTTWLSWNDLETDTPEVKQIAMNFEAPYT